MQNEALNNREMHRELAKHLNCGKFCISTGADLYFVRHACMFLGISKKTLKLRDLPFAWDYLVNQSKVHATQYLSIMSIKNAKYTNL